MTKSKRPNFILFIADQMRADHTGFTGNRIVKTPNLDALAEAGSWWSKNYVASPTCMSNRATLMTGRMPSLNGVLHNGRPLDLSSVTFVDLLRAAGYRTALMGKSHIQGITQESPKVRKREFPSHLSEPPLELSEAKRQAFGAEHYKSEMSELWNAEPEHEKSVPLPYYGFEKVRFCSGHGDRVSGHYGNWLREIGYSSGSGIENSVAASKSGAPQVYKPAMSEEEYPTNYITNVTIDTLNEFADGDQPFFLQCSFPDPHHPFTPPGKYWDMFDPSDMELPASFYQPSKNAVPPLKRMWELFESGEKNIRWTHPFVTGEEQAKEIYAKTFGQIAMVDDAIGRVLDHLEYLRLNEETIICFMSDHGDYLGDHGLFLKGPINYQSIIRTPLIWKDPNSDFNGGHQSSLCSTLDFPISVLYRAGLQPTNGMQGRDLFSEKRADDDGIIVELTTAYPTIGFEEAISVTTLIKKDWRLSIWENCDWGELYNLNDDPSECQNLWDVSDFSEIKSKLMLELVHKIQSNRDSSPYPLSVA